MASRSVNEVTLEDIDFDVVKDTRDTDDVGNPTPLQKKMKHVKWN